MLGPAHTTSPTRFPGRDPRPFHPAEDTTSSDLARCQSPVTKGCSIAFLDDDTIDYVISKILLSRWLGKSNHCKIFDIQYASIQSSFFDPSGTESARTPNLPVTLSAASTDWAVVSKIVKSVLPLPLMRHRRSSSRSDSSRKVRNAGEISNAGFSRSFTSRGRSSRRSSGSRRTNPARREGLPRDRGPFRRIGDRPDP